MRILPVGGGAEQIKSLSLFDDAVETEETEPKRAKNRAFHKFYDAAELTRLEHILAGGNDTYISQAVFDKPKRREVNVSSIQTLFVDLDTYNVGMDTDAAITRIDEIFNAIGLIDPTITTMSSGRGLYVKIPLDKAVQRTDLPKWKAVERGLINGLALLGADPKVKDASRVLRAVGTRNGKNGATVEVLRQANKTVSLESVDAALEKAGMYTEKASRKARSQRHTISADAPVITEELDEEEKGWCSFMTPFDLSKFQADIDAKQAQKCRGKQSMLRHQNRAFCWSALADIDRLAQVRGGAFSHGIRDASVFWSLVLLINADLVSPENFYTEACALTARTVGAYNPLLDGSLSTLFTRLCNRTAFRVDSVYTATKERLMDEMNITSDEERCMSVLCSRTEYQRRVYASQRHVRQLAGMEDLRANERNMMVRIARYVKAERLAAFNQGRSPRLSALDVGKKMGVHEKTAKKYLARLELCQ